LKWDEDNIQLTESQKNSTMKISEPKTPFIHYNQETDEIMTDLRTIPGLTLESSSSTENKNLRSSSVSPVGSLSSVSPSSAHFPDSIKDEWESEGHSDEDEETKEKRRRRFAELRAKHYNMKEALSLGHKLVENDIDEDDDDNSNVSELKAKILGKKLEEEENNKNSSTSNGGVDDDFMETHSASFACVESINNQPTMGTVNGVNGGTILSFTPTPSLHAVTSRMPSHHQNGCANFTFQLPSTVNASKKNTNSAERRANHNAVERARRECLNTKFQELAHALPSLAQVRRPSKSIIVQKSLEFIYKSRQRDDKHDEEMRSIRISSNEIQLKTEDSRSDDDCSNDDDYDIESSELIENNIETNQTTKQTNQQTENPTCFYDSTFTMDMSPIDHLVDANSLHLQFDHDPLNGNDMSPFCDSFSIQQIPQKYYPSPPFEATPMCDISTHIQGFM
ncbi:7494_t:CDS:2, partial [Diversispora eburnea]